MNESLAKEHLKSTRMPASMTLLVLMAMFFLASSTDVPLRNQNPNLIAAISEMEKANYFTFIMLLNMISPFDERFRGNLTFLMPNDRMLSKITLHQDCVTDFLLRHSIPSPLLFDHLQRIPTGSIIPSSKPDYVLKIFNNGRRNFFINNAKLISPNICTAGSAIRCHGIDGALLSTANPAITVKNSSTTTPASCFSTSSPASPAVPLSPAPSPPLSNLNTTPVTGMLPRSGSSISFGGENLTLSVTCVILSLWISSLSIVI